MSVVNMITTRYVGALHTAYLDPLAGTGVLVKPNDRTDVWMGPCSLHGSDWDVAMRELLALGVEPLTDEYGDLVIEGYTADGCEVVALYVKDSIVSEPSMEQIRSSTVALRAVAGVMNG